MPEIDAAPAVETGEPGRPQPPNDDPSERRGAFRALRHRNYRLYFFGQLISLAGTWMQSAAQAWLVLKLTNSATMLGVVSFAQFTPILLVGLFAGVIVDRVDRRRLIITTQILLMLSAFTLAALTWTGTVRVGLRDPAGGIQRHRRIVRHAGPPVVRGRDGGLRRSRQRDRAQLDDVQQRAHARSGGGGIADRVARHRHLLFPERREFPRRHLEPDPDGHPRARDCRRRRAHDSSTARRPRLRLEQSPDLLPDGAGGGDQRLRLPVSGAGAVVREERAARRRAHLRIPRRDAGTRLGDRRGDAGLARVDAGDEEQSAGRAVSLRGWNRGLRDVAIDSRSRSPRNS